MVLGHELKVNLIPHRRSDVVWVVGELTTCTYGDGVDCAKNGNGDGSKSKRCGKK